MDKQAMRWVLPAVLLAGAGWLGGAAALAEDAGRVIGPIGPPPVGPAAPSAEHKARSMLAGARKQIDQQPEDARAGIRQALQTAPRSATIRIEAAELLAQMGRVEQAVSELTVAIELADAPAKALDQRAFMHLRLGQFDKAFADSNRAIVLEPTNPRYRWGRAHLWREAQAPDRVAREALQALELTPADDREMGMWMAARNLLSAGRLDESERLARQLIAQQKGLDGAGRACLALVLAERGQIEKALQEVDKLRGPERPKRLWREMRCLVLLRGGRFAECRRLAEDLLAESDRDPAGWSLRGLACLHLGRLDKAMADAREGIKRENWHAHHPRLLLARAWYLQDPTDPRAGQALEQAIQKTPQHTGMITLGYLAARQAGQTSARQRLAAAYKTLYYKKGIGARGLAYLLGQIDREQLLAELNALPDYWKRKHRPGIYYVLAAQAGLDGQADRRRKWLREAIKDAPPDNFPALAARRELKALAAAGTEPEQREDGRD